MKEEKIKPDKLQRVNFLFQLHSELENMKKSEPNGKLKRVITDMLQTIANKTAADEMEQTNLHSFSEYEPRSNPQHSRELVSLMKKTRSQEHVPAHTAKFLALFSNDPDLKFVTHDWDDSRGPFNHEDFLYNIHTRFEKALRDPQYSGVPFTTLMKVFTFLFNQDPENGWGYERIPLGWSFPEITRWCRNNTGVFPIEMPLPQEFRKYKLRGKTKRYQSFGDLIQKFRKEIRFVNEGNHLFHFLNNKVDENGLHLDHNTILEKTLNGLDFCVDVDKFGAGLKGVFDGMKKRKEFRNIVFSGKREAGKIILSIFQEGSFIERSSPEEKKIRPGTLGGDYENTRKNLFSQCDWSFEGPFQNGNSWAMHYLRPSDQPEVTPSACTTGVQHTFTFYQP